MALRRANAEWIFPVFSTHSKIEADRLFLADCTHSSSRPKAAARNPRRATMRP